MKLLLVFLSFIFVFQLNAQDYSKNYIPTRSGGQIPKDIITTSTEKYQVSLENIDAKDSKTIQNDKGNFYLESTFVLDEMMRSGKILFNEPLSNFVNEVAENLLKSDPELRKTLNFYVIKSTVVNAFATDRGNVFVTVGLLSRLETEAQLAYILAHEIVHVQEQHNIQTYVEYADIDRENGYKSVKSYEKLLEKNNYSKDLEREADEEGLDIFLNSNYSFETIEGVFNILERSAFPYSNDTLDFPKLLPPTIVLDSSVIKFEASPQKIEEINENRSTHPSVDERRIAFADFIKEKNNAEKSTFIIGEKQFKNMREMARFELCNISIANLNYVSALYDAYQLLDKYPENEYLKKTISFSMYALAQYTNEERYSDVVPLDYFEFEGQYQRLMQFLQNLQPKEINILAVLYTWDMYQQYPNRESYRMIAQDMVEDAIIYSSNDEHNFNNYTGAYSIDSIIDNYSYNTAFDELMKEDSIQSWVKKGIYYKKKFKAQEEEYPTIAIQKQREKERKERAEIGESIGLDKIVFMDPTYVYVNERRKPAYQYVISEEKELKFNTWLTNQARTVGLESEILTLNLLSEEDITNYNDFVLVNDWMQEQVTHGMYLINSNYDEIQLVAEKYGTNNFAISGNLTFRSKYNPYRSILIYSMGILHPGLFLEPAIGSSYESMFYNLTFDVKNNRKLFHYANISDIKNYDVVVNQNIYWTLLQLKRKKSK